MIKKKIIGSKVLLGTVLKTYLGEKKKKKQKQKKKRKEERKEPPPKEIGNGIYVFPHPLNKNKSADLIGLLWGLNELIFLKMLGKSAGHVENYITSFNKNV